MNCVRRSGMRARIALGLTMMIAALVLFAALGASARTSHSRKPAKHATASSHSKKATGTRGKKAARATRTRPSTHRATSRAHTRNQKQSKRTARATRRRRREETPERAPEETAPTPRAMPVAHPSQTAAEQMLREAYELSRPLEAKQRVVVLERLLYVMPPEVLGADKRRWASELFEVAHVMPADDTAAQTVRNTALATAATRLSIYDADRALALLDTLASERGEEPDARLMAARLVFPRYLQQHGVAGTKALLTYGKRWGESGGFPYTASLVLLSRLNEAKNVPKNEATAYFQQMFVVFCDGHEGLYGLRDFANLTERSRALGIIDAEQSERAGQEIVRQLRQRLQQRTAAGLGLANDELEQTSGIATSLTAASPLAWSRAERNYAELTRLPTPKAATPPTPAKVEPELQSAFRELSTALRNKNTSEQLQSQIDNALQLVQKRYDDSPCADCLTPDAQSQALIALAASAEPLDIAERLKAFRNAFWHAYFLAIAARQVGDPTQVIDPTARHTSDDGAGSEEN